MLGSILGGAACLAAFVLWERRHPMPLLPLRLFRSRNFSVTNIETLAVYGGLSAFFFFLMLFLQEVAGYSPVESGLAALPVTIFMFLGSRYIGRLSMRLGPRLFMSLGPLVAGVSALALARLPTHPSYSTDLLPSILGFALGLTFTVAPLTTTVLSDAGPTDAGIASGVNNAVARVGGLLSIAVVGLAASTDGGLTTRGFHLAMAITGLLMCTGGVIGAVGIRNPERSSGRSSRSADSPESQPIARPTPSRPA